MAKLSEQLKYFVNKEIDKDPNWRECQVILFDHYMPGEGSTRLWSTFAGPELNKFTTPTFDTICMV